MVENPVSNWPDYYRATLDKPIHPLYGVLEPLLPPSGKAIELGCGVGHGVLWLLDRGYATTALDVTPEALAHLAARVPAERRNLLEVVVADMVSYPLQAGAFDLVVAGFSLFFLDRTELGIVWKSIRTGLKPKGLFMGQFLGTNDEWAGRFTAHSRQEVEAMMAGMDVLHHEDVERDGATAQGTPKHWHVHHLIARKPA